MTDFYLGDLRTGRISTVIPGSMVAGGSWDDRLNAVESLSASFDLRDPDVRSFDVPNAGAPGKAFLARVDGDHVVAGPIWSRTYSLDTGMLGLNAKGLGSYFAFRHVMPPAGADLPVFEWTVRVPDPEREDEFMWVTNPVLTSHWSGLSLGTIIKRIVQQTEAWWGGDLPIVYGPDVPGNHERTYTGVEFKPVLEAIEDIAGVHNGAEWRFTPRLIVEEMRFEWVLETGEPLLVTDAHPVWDATRPESTMRGLTVDEDASDLAGLSWQTGGKADEKVLIARAADTRLVDAGFPLLEVHDSSHSSVSRQVTLDAWAEAGLEDRVWQTWAFSTDANPVDEFGQPAGPVLGQYRTGDYATLRIGDDPFLPAQFRSRIVGLSGSHDSSEVTVQLAPRLED